MDESRPFPRFIDAPLKDKMILSILEIERLRERIKPSNKDAIIEALKKVEDLKRSLHRVLNNL